MTAVAIAVTIFVTLLLKIPASRTRFVATLPFDLLLIASIAVSDRR